MAFGYYDNFPPYVPVAQRLANARRELKKLEKKTGRAAEPVVVEGRGRAIAKTFWGQAWCENLEQYGDYETRLPRGRTYLRNGSVLDLSLAPGRVEARVAGTELYKVRVDIKPLTPARWAALKAACGGRIASVVSLLGGELGDDVLSVLTAAGTGLFPAPREIAMSCSCPDFAGLCKHLAATLYGVGVRLDSKPELFFTLRKVDKDELIAQAVASDLVGTRAKPGRKRIATKALSSVFGIDLETKAPRRR